MESETILIIGANGQIGTVLSKTLRQHYGADRVVCTDLRPSEHPEGPFERLDVLDRDRLSDLIKTYNVKQIYHLAAVLSAKGEQQPLQTWDINMSGLFNVLEAARELDVQKLFWPSSIGVFGPETPQVNTPQHTILEPTTVYGISKVAGEHWCQYYFNKYGLDSRSLRFPGIIGYQSAPGGGTTDYAVDIYHKAVKREAYECFLREDTRLPMIYMEDAIRATIELMEAPADQIKVRTSYNLSGMDFTPAEITTSIRKHYPDFKVSYQPDFRQAIADSWSDSIDDSHARNDWGWQPKCDLASMTADMIKHLRAQYQLEVE
jgi:threonine 3-dehydrogenase